MKLRYKLALTAVLPVLVGFYCGWNLSAWALFMLGTLQGYLIEMVIPK
jgi:hypothetical protein